MARATPQSQRDGPYDPRSRRLKRAGYSLLALGGAALAVSGTALLTGLVRLERIEDHCRAQPGGQCFESDARERQHAARLDLLSSLSIGALVLAGVSGVGAASALTFNYYRRGHAIGEQREIVIGLTARGRF